MKQNIVLTGILGSGKSSLGRLIAPRLHMTYVDMDTVIEEETGTTITELFRQFGESHFRDLETALCHRLSRSEGLVISTGGGVILREENMKALKENGLVILIDRDPQTILRTIDCSNRPLLRDHPERLLELYQQRLPLYRRYSDLIFSDRGTLTEAADALTEQLQQYITSEEYIHNKEVRS